MKRVTAGRAGGVVQQRLADRLAMNPDFFWMWGRPPKHPVEVDDLGVVHVYGYPEALEVLTNPQLYSNNVARLMVGEVEVDEKFHEGTLLQADPPGHSKLRKIISRVFTPKMVASLEPRIAEVTHELLDQVAGSDRLELVNDLTYPMPVTVISEMLGIPHSDRDLFRAWVDRMATSAVALTNGSHDGEAVDTQAAMRTIPELYEYLLAHAVERRAKPREDLLTKLVQAEVDGERLSDSAIVNFANELLVVGHVTTSALLGNTVVCLDEFPEVGDRVRADPSLTARAIDEALRFMSPIVISYKAATTRTEIAGVPIYPDQLVAVTLAAANRDERQFPHPHTFDLDRESNQHLAFGKGIHFCIGAPLARLEGKVAVDILLDRFPKLRRDPDNKPELIPLPHVIVTSKLPLLT